MNAYATVPTIDPTAAESVLQPEGENEGYWVGAPATVEYGDATYLVVRWRTPEERGHSLSIYRYRGAGALERVREITADELGARSVERAAPVVDPRTGKLKLYVSVDDGPIWRIKKLDDVSDPATFEPESASAVVTPTPGTTDQAGVKDPYVVTVGGQYGMYYTGHDGFSEQAHCAVSDDGKVWTPVDANPVLERGAWHDHHTRIACVLPARDAPVWHVFYEGSGREDYERTWNVRTGTAISHDLTRIVDTSTAEPYLSAPRGEEATAASTFRTCRYLDVIDRGEHWDVFFECARDDGAFELRRATVAVTDRS